MIIIGIIILAALLIAVASRCAGRELDQKTWERIEGWRK